MFGLHDEIATSDAHVFSISILGRSPRHDPTSWRDFYRKAPRLTDVEGVVRVLRSPPFKRNRPICLNNISERRANDQVADY
jgi:hypothetical protein